MSKISQLFPPSPAFTEASLPDLAGKVFLITGATSGVGLELARILYAANGTVYVGGRDEDKIKDCIRGIISQQTQSSSPPSGSGPGQESNSQCQSNSKTTTAKTGGGGRGGKGRGKLHPFKADLSDLLTIPSAVASFLTKESRLDGLIHNAGVMNPPLERSLSEQGHEVQMATHCLGPFLLTGLLAGLLRRTASSSFSPSLSTSAPAFSFLSPSAPAPAPASGSGSGSEASPSTAGVEKKWDGTAAGEKVGGEGRGGGQGPRVVWVSSMISLGAPKGGIVWDSDSEGINNGPKLAKASMENYMQSKVGSVFLAHEYARRLGRDGVISVSVNPGLMKTDLQRHMPAAMGTVMNVVFKGPKFGAYTELYAALSPEITLESTCNKPGAFVIPWGRIGTVPCDIAAGLKPESEGGTGLSEKFWAWCERQTLAYMQTGVDGLGMPGRKEGAERV